MAGELTIPAGATEKVVTGVAAGGTGLAMSFITKQWPLSGGVITTVTGVAGLLLAVLLGRGPIADMCEGIGAGGLAIAGSQFAWGPEPAGGGARGYTQIQGGKKITLQLKGGGAGATGEVAAKAPRAMSAIEF